MGSNWNKREETSEWGSKNRKFDSRRFKHANHAKAINESIESNQPHDDEPSITPVQRQRAAQWNLAKYAKTFQELD